jgi:hypothetical protein
MKNRVTKLVLLVLSLALLVGGAIGISVSAESTAPEIISKNVMDTGDFCLMFAVDPATVAGEEVTLRVYDRDPSDADKKLAFEETKAKTATENIDLDGDREPETAVIVFTTAGVSAKDFADVWYIETESAGAKKVITYSVMEYAFERLYRDGTVLASDKDADLYRYYQKEFYFGMLDMGSAAQNLHVNYGKAEAERERLVKEYTYVSVLDGTFTAGEVTADRGFVEANTSITLNANDTEAIKGWSIFTYGQNGVEIDRKVANDGSAITVTGNTVVIPYEIGVTAGKYFDEIGQKGIYDFSNMSYRNYVGESGDDYLAKTSYSNDGVYFYKFEDTGYDGYGKALTLYKTAEAASQCIIHFPIADTTNSEANCVVFEYDFLYTGMDLYYSGATTEGNITSNSTHYFSLNAATIQDTSGKNWTQLGKGNANTTGYDYKKIEWQMFTYDLDGVTTFDSATSNYKSEKGTNSMRLPGSTTDLEANKWYNICFEIYTDAKVWVIYVDGVAVSSGSFSADLVIADLDSISFLADYRIRNYEMIYDNVCGAKIKKEYKAQ